MGTPQGDVANFPNADEKYKETIGDKEVMTGEGQIGLTDLLSAFRRNGVRLDGDGTKWTGIQDVEFNDAGKTNFTLGGLSNIYYNKSGKETTPSVPKYK